jgi:C4-dicarboxylate transporter DctM subunit
MIGILIFLGFLILILSGIPIAFSMILTGILFILFFGGRSATILTSFNRLAAGFSFPLLAIYFYILLGIVMNETKISEYLVGFFKKLAGKIFKVGISGMIMILSCAATGTLTGSAVGTTTAIGGIMIPQMKKYNYKPTYLVTLLSYSGILGTLIPPSISGLVYAIVVSLPVLTVWITVGGVGILFTIVLLIANYVVSKKRNYEPYDDVSKESSISLAKSFIITLPALLVPIGVLGSIYGGIATPTEAGVMGVLITIILGIFYYKTITSIKQISQAIYKSACQTAVIMFLICASFSLSHALTSTGIIKLMARSVLLMTNNKYILLLLVELLILFLGCFLDDGPIMILLGPIASAILIPMGIHPLHLAAIFVFAGVLAMVTPPVGIVLYAASAVVGIPFGNAVIEIWKFFLPALVILLIITFFPAIVLFLPKIFGLI